MKIKVLKKKLITEAAMGPRDLPENAYVTIRDAGGELEIIYTTKDGYDLSNIQSEVRGMIKMSKNTDAEKCVKDVWIVGVADAASGWGPMLYEVAIEYASKHGKGLTSDRQLVSTAAKGVYDFYQSKRSDVQKVQMDISKRSVKAVFGDEDKIKQLTPDDKSDDCDQIVSIFYSAGMGDWKTSSFQSRVKNAQEDPFDNEWHKESTSKILVKNSPIVSNMLKKAGKLRMDL
jgi:hypothetical protein